MSACVIYLFSIMMIVRFTTCSAFDAWQEQKYYDGKREAEGFVGGTGVKSSGKGFFR